MSDINNRASGQPWARRYQDGDTPWNLGGPHPELSTRLQDGRLAPPDDRPGRALVPGAGAGHDALALARRGWRVTAVDVVESIAHEVAPALERLGGRYEVADVLDLAPEEPFDLIWDHTFFCAIDTAARRPWGERARDLVVPGGWYAALVFPMGKPEAEGGPPFGMTPDDVLEVLGASFLESERVQVARPVPRRTWREYWLLAERRALSIRG